MAGLFRGARPFGSGGSIFVSIKSHPYVKVAVDPVAGVSTRRLQTTLCRTVSLAKAPGLSTHSSHATRFRTAPCFEICQRASYATHSQTPPETPERDPYWAKIPMWSDITADEFIKYEFQASELQIISGVDLRLTPGDS